MFFLPSRVPSPPHLTSIRTKHVGPSAARRRAGPGRGEFTQLSPGSDLHLTLKYSSYRPKLQPLINIPVTNWAALDACSSQVRTVALNLGEVTFRTLHELLT